MRLLFAVAFTAVSILPASASFGLMCEGPDGVSLEAPLGGAVGLTVMSATITASGRTWTTETSLEDPQAMVPAQAFSANDMMWIDLADANLERNVAEVPLFVTSDEAIGGTLSMPDVGAWVISCSMG